MKRWSLPELQQLPLLLPFQRPPALQKYPWAGACFHQFPPLFQTPGLESKGWLKSGKRTDLFLLITSNSSRQCLCTSLMCHPPPENLINCHNCGASFFSGVPPQGTSEGHTLGGHLSFPIKLCRTAIKRQPWSLPPRNALQLPRCLLL